MCRSSRSASKDRHLVLDNHPVEDGDAWVARADDLVVDSLARIRPGYVPVHVQQQQQQQQQHRERETRRLVSCVSSSATAHSAAARVLLSWSQDLERGGSVSFSVEHMGRWVMGHGEAYSKPCIGAHSD